MILIVLAAIGALVAPTDSTKPDLNKEPGEPEQASADVSKPKPNTPNKPTQKTKRVVKYFAETPTKASKDKLTIGDKKLSGISKVKLVLGADGFAKISIMHSSGVKSINTDQVPLAFAELWDISEDSVKSFYADMAKRDQAKIEASKKRAKAKSEALLAEVGKEPSTSGWDGSVRCVKDYLKKNVKDPSSLKFQDWFKPMLVEVDGKKYWRVKVTYRAKNSFGAVVLETGYAFIRHNQVVDFKTES